MANINTVALSGNLTRDPELRTFGDDGKVVNMGMAVNRSRFNKDTQEYDEEVSFVDVTVWGNFGALCARKLRKGNRVTVTGRLEQQTWEKDGEKRSKLVVIAEQVDADALFLKDEDVPPAEAPTAAPQVAAPAAQPAAASTAGTLDEEIPF